MAKLEIGKTYNFAGYQWIACEELDDGKRVVLQSAGVTHGKWPGYVLPEFGDGYFFDEDIYSLDISEYDDKTKSLYEQIKAVEYQNNMYYGNGLYLVSDYIVKYGNSNFNAALTRAAVNHEQFGTTNSAAWLGTVDSGNYAWYVYSVGGVNLSNGQNNDYVVAPAFNLDISKIEVVGDKIVIRDDYLETEKEYTQEEVEIMAEYEAAVDPDIIDFVNDVRNDRDTLPITVAFLSEEAAYKIERLTQTQVAGNRVVLDANAVRHIDKRHGVNGEADHSMANTEDIARIRYVLDNYDSIKYSGEVAEGYVDKNCKLAPKIIITKKIDGTYFVIEAVSDSKKKRNYIVSAFKKKRTDV